MRPILLKGHERAITFVRYNKEGDLLFSCAKDGTPCAWYSDNGERLGTFEGHTGAVWMLDVSYDSKYLVTASADMSVRLFAVETGECLKVLQHPGPTRACCFAEGGRHFATGANPFRGEDARLRIYEIPEDVSKMSDAPIVENTRSGLPKHKYTCMQFYPVNKYLMCGAEDGSLRIYDPKTLVELACFMIHTKSVEQISWNGDQTMFVTGSKDNLCHLFDTAEIDRIVTALNGEHEVGEVEELKPMHTYTTDRPVNGCCISPLKPHVLTGGGQEAMSVALTAGTAGKFETRFFHMVFENQFGMCKGHFGPINAMAFHPNGRQFCTGGEDGYVRIQILDDDYFAEDEDDEILKGFSREELLGEIEAEKRDGAGAAETKA